MTVTAERRPLASYPTPAAGPLSFSSCVPRHLVHLRAVSEVLMTDWRSTGEHSFECGAQWSRSRSFYRVRDGRHDPLPVAETLRQAGIMLCHVAYDVPQDHSFLMDRLALETACSLGRAGARVPILRSVRFPGPPSEPDVPVSEHPALHEFMSLPVVGVLCCWPASREWG